MAIPQGDMEQRKSKIQEQSPHFTIFVRLPFPRGDFVDPPPVLWNSVKDAALWDIISKASNGEEVDWHALAEEFEVTLAFLLQQAAWLYERQLSQVRAQLRKVNRPVSIGTPPMPSAVLGSGYVMNRGPSHGSRLPSSLANRTREQAMSKDDTISLEAPSQSKGPRLSRTSSTNTVLQVQRSPSTAYQTSQADTAFSQKGRNEGHEPSGKSVEGPTGQRKQPFERPRTPPPRVKESITSSSSESEFEPEAQAAMLRSRAYTRRPRYSSSKGPLGALSDADEDLENSPPFLPFSEAKVTAKSAAQSSDPSATLRVPPKAQASQRLSPKAETRSKQSSNAAQNVNSSSSSAQSQPARPPKAPLSSLSPRQRRLARKGSEGTPSMGSSFSDLDDASVTQSALEEALANEMRHGGVASRMSTISQALRSRYL